MVLATHTKQPAEKEKITVDFANRLATSETLSSVTVTSILVIDDSDTTATIISGAVYSGTKISFYVNAGTNGQNHKITISVGTSDAQILEEDIYLNIRAQ